MPLRPFNPETDADLLPKPQGSALRPFNPETDSHLLPPTLDEKMADLHYEPTETEWMEWKPSDLTFEKAAGLVKDGLKAAVGDMKTIANSTAEGLIRGASDLSLIVNKLTAIGFAGKGIFG